MNHPYLKQLQHYGVALFIFLSGLVISLAVFRFYQMQDINQTKAEFNRLADLQLFFIKDILNETMEQIDEIKQFYLAANLISKEDFHILVRNSFNLYPNLLAIGWIDQQLQGIQKDSGLEFKDLNFLDFTHDHFFPFTYLEKSHSSEDFYIDNRDYPQFLTLLKESLNYPGISVSNDINFFQKGRKKGFFLFNSVEASKKGDHQTIPLSGILVGFSDFENILKNTRYHIEPAGINIGIYNIVEEGEQLLYWSPSVLQPDVQNESSRAGLLQKQWIRSHVFSFGNRVWKLTATPARAFLLQHKHWGHWEIPIIGILLSGLTSFYFLVLVNRRILIEKEVQVRTKELASINRLLQQEIAERQIIEENITKKRKEYEKSLIKAMREAKDANEAKSEFLATISHELRTPLNVIIGFDQCLLMEMDGPINEQQRKSLQKIEKSSFHLLTSINDILDFAKIEASKMELEITPHNIIEILNSCIEEIQPLAIQKNLDLTLSCNTSSLFIEIDKMRIRQVVLNLLSNAVKFTEKGSIKVVLIDNPNQIEICVIDTGIGLSQEEILKIFHPFTQADSSITRKYGGTGLGLMISKRIVELHGGVIAVESQKGKGSTFIVEIPKIPQSST